MALNTSKQGRTSLLQIVLAERMVQAFKKALKTSCEPLRLTMDRFLFNYRLTPHLTTGVSHAELLFGRKLRSKLDLHCPDNKISARVPTKQESQKRYYTKGRGK